MARPPSRRVAAAAGALALVGLLLACDASAGRSPTLPGGPSSAPSERTEPSASGTGSGTTAGSTTATSTSTSPGATAPVAARPNILVIEADDMRSDELRWMPHTRRMIADVGLTFDNSFAPYPLCCPSRASFLSGEYAHNHGVLSHVDPYGFHVFDDSSTLATKLRSTGYQTALIGKYLNGYGEQPTRAGADSLTYVPPGWTQWWGSSDHDWQPGDPFQGGTYNYFNLVSDVNGTTQGWPGQYTTDVTSAQTSNILSDFARQPDRPWFVWWTPIAPHYGMPDEPDDPGRIARSDGFVVDWETPARPDDVKGRFDHRITHGLGTPLVGSAEADLSDKPAYLRTYPELTDAEKIAERTVTRQRAEALSVLDDRIADVLRGLAASGQASNTIVVFTSDNGYYLGEHRKRQGKINLHEPSIRVPLLIAGPGITVGRRYDPITTIDLSATLASLAGVRLDAPDGMDMRRVIAKGDQGWRRPVVLEGLMPEARYAEALNTPGWPSRLDTVGIRLGRWKYVRYDTGEAELYDLWHDPLELQSLDHDPAYATIRGELDQLWSATINCKGDGCRQALPADLQIDAHDERVETRAQANSVDKYFGN